MPVRRPSAQAAVLASALATVVLASAVPGAAAAAAAPVEVVGARAAGAPWTPVPSPAQPGEVDQAVLRSVTAPAPGQVFAAGYTRHQLRGVFETRTLVQRWDGAAWQVMDTPDRETAPARNELSAIDGSSASDVWAVGTAALAPGDLRLGPYVLHYDGTRWQPVTVPEPLGGYATYMEDVVSVSRSEAWAVGSSGMFPRRPVVFRWNGTAWSARFVTVAGVCDPSDSAELTSVAAGPSGEVFAAGYCATDGGTDAVTFVLQRTATGWVTAARTQVGDFGIQDLTVTSTGEVWAVGILRLATGEFRGFTLVRRGTTWTRSVRPGSSQRWESFYGVAEGPDGVVVVGTESVLPDVVRPLVLKRTATGWERSFLRPAPTVTARLYGVAAAGSTLWAVGETVGVRGTIPYVARSRTPRSPR